jgi:hypothetical protein
MAYGNAGRALAAIRFLEAETRDLLGSLGQLSPEQAQWLHDTAEPGSRRLRPAVTTADRPHVPDRVQCRGRAVQVSRVPPPAGVLVWRVPPLF